MEEGERIHRELEALHPERFRLPARVRERLAQAKPSASHQDE
jgi:hypothetical protein